MFWSLKNNEIIWCRFFEMENSCLEDMLAENQLFPTRLDAKPIQNLKIDSVDGEENRNITRHNACDMNLL